MPSPQVEIVVIALGTPLLVGIYREGKLTQKIVSRDKTSEALPRIFEDILKKYSIKRVYYAKGPGSFMAIKLAYIFLKSLQIVKNFELYGCEGFVFNENRPIKAVGNLYFVKENDKIVTKKIDNPIDWDFQLPKKLDNLNCSLDTAPLYVIPAV